MTARLKGLGRPVSHRPPQGPARRRLRAGHRLQNQGYAWLVPAVVVSIGILYFCLFETSYNSVLDWDGVSPKPVYVGLRNYSELFHDAIFWRALLHCAVYFVVTFAVQTTLGIVFAALLHSGVRLASVYKVIIFIPVVLAPAIMAPVFRQIFAAHGQLNWVLEHVGLGFVAQPWIADSNTSLLVIMALQVWEFTGLTFILYYGAFGQVDPSAIEAARLDGAGNARTLISIALPSARGTTVALFMLSIIGALKTFDLPFLVTAGGPNYSTEVMSTFIYRQSITLARVGYGAAASIALLFIAVGLSLLFSRLARRTEND